MVCDWWLILAHRDSVLIPQLLRQQLEQSWDTGGLQIVAAVVVDRAAHRRFDRVGRVEAHVSLIQTKWILDGVHHVADADDA